MLLKEKSKDLTRRKEVKIRIPVRLHIKLHSMKVLTGKHISDAITEALEGYFEANRPRQEMVTLNGEVAPEAVFAGRAD